MSELEANVSTAHQDHLFREGAELKKLVAGGQVLGAIERKARWLGARGDQNMTRFQAFSPDLDRIGSDETGGAVEGVNILCPEECFALGRNRVSERALESSHVQPVKGQG